MNNIKGQMMEIKQIKQINNSVQIEQMNNQIQPIMEKNQFEKIGQMNPYDTFGLKKSQKEKMIKMNE